MKLEAWVSLSRLPDFFTPCSLFAGLLPTAAPTRVFYKDLTRKASTVPGALWYRSLPGSRTHSQMDHNIPPVSVGTCLTLCGSWAGSWGAGKRGAASTGFSPADALEPFDTHTGNCGLS